jgi:hypothetical protein
MYTESRRNKYVCTEIMWKARKVEYIGEFETKIENILGCLSSPSHADAPLSLNCLFIMLS